MMISMVVLPHHRQRSLGPNMGSKRVGTTTYSTVIIRHDGNLLIRLNSSIDHSVDQEALFQRSPY